MIIDMGELVTSAEGATAPETLRQKDRVVFHTLESGVKSPAEGITISGEQDRGGIAAWAKTYA